MYVVATTFYYLTKGKVMTRELYLYKWGMHIEKLERLTADHAAGMNRAAFKAIADELRVYAKVAWDVSQTKGTEPPMP